MVSAGHPPPLLRLPGGRVERLPEATHAPLGVGDGAGARRATSRSRPVPCVLGYTDGLVERRGEAIDVGITRLADVFATTNGSVWGAVSGVLRGDGTRRRRPGQRRRRRRRRPAPEPDLIGAAVDVSARPSTRGG